MRNSISNNLAKFVADNPQKNNLFLVLLLRLIRHDKNDTSALFCKEFNQKVILVRIMLSLV